QYVAIGRHIAEHGLVSEWAGSNSRTYGYPFLMSLVLRATAWTGVSFAVLLFELQLLAYCAAVLFLRNVLAPVAPTAARIAFCGMLVNYYVLIYTPLSLTESVSVTLVVSAAAWWITLWRNGLAAWPLIAGSLTVGFGFMVRPANAFMVVAWVFGFAILCFRQRPAFLRTAVYLAILLVAVV